MVNSEINELLKPVTFDTGVRTVTNLYGTVRARFTNISEPGNSLDFLVGRAPVRYIDERSDSTIKLELSSQWDVVYRKDTKIDLGVHSTDYTLTQNHDLLSIVEEQLIEYFDPYVLRDVEVQDSVQQHGAVCIRQYIFPRISASITTNSGHVSPIRFRAIVWNCFNGRHKAKIIFGDIDMFCANGLITGEYDMVEKKRTKGLDIRSFKGPLSHAFERFEDRIAQYQEWAYADVTVDAVDKFFEEISGPRLADGFKDQFREEVATRGRNVWAVVSTLSNYSSHTVAPSSKENRGNRDMLTQNTNQKRVSGWLKSDSFQRMLGETV